MTATREEILSALEGLGALYPEMRFGQLVLLAATLAQDETTGSFPDVPDREFLRATRDHCAERRRQLGIPNGVPESAISLLRRELLEALRAGANGGVGFCAALAELASNARIPVYDLEDADLLQVAASSASR